MCACLSVHVCIASCASCATSAACAACAAVVDAAFHTAEALRAAAAEGLKLARRVTVGFIGSATMHGDGLDGARLDRAEQSQYGVRAWSTGRQM